MADPFTGWAMNAFLYLVPIFCAARAFVDHREGRNVWSLVGGLSAAILLLPVLSAYLLPIGELAWAMLSIIVLGSLGIIAYCVARAFVDFRERRYVWGLLGVLSTLMLLLPHLVTILAPPAMVTIG